MTDGRVPYRQHTVEDFMKHDLKVLFQKRAEANLCIAVAKRGLEEGDVRGPAAVMYYRGERERINEAIKRKKFGDDGPPDQTVGLKAIAAVGESKRMAFRGWPMKHIRRMLRSLIP